MGTKDPRDGSQPEFKQVEHSGKVMAGRPSVFFPMLLISEPDGIMTRDRLEQLRIVVIRLFGP
jgi:hypothetical protein